MKKILKLSVLPLLFLSIMSCSSDDENTVATPSTAPELISPEDGTAIVLDPLYETNPAVTLVWNHAGYDVPTEVTYNVEVAMAGTDFADIAPAGSATSNRVLTLTVSELNSAAIAAGLEPFEAGELDMRVVATLGDNADMRMESNVITVTVTPYTSVDPVLYLVGASQAYYDLNAWDPSTAMPMRYIGDGETQIFEAYVKVGLNEDGSPAGLKFAGTQGTWGEVDAAGNYGMGTEAGTLVNSGGASDIKPGATDGPGLYYIQVDLDEMSYKTIKMNWGIIGDATPGGWNNETPMNYDFDTNTFTLSTTLTDGELKFRSKNTGDYIYAGESNSEWMFNVGESNPMVTYNPAAPNFDVTAGSYDLELTINFDGTAVVSGL